MAIRWDSFRSSDTESRPAIVGTFFIFFVSSLSLSLFFLSCSLHSDWFRSFLFRIQDVCPSPVFALPPEMEEPIQLVQLFATELDNRSKVCFFFQSMSTFVSVCTSYGRVFIGRQPKWKAVSISNVLAHELRSFLDTPLNYANDS